MSGKIHPRLIFLPAQFLRITGCSVPCSLPHYQTEIQSVIDLTSGFTPSEENKEKQVFLELHIHIPEAVVHGGDDRVPAV